jgi:hypothetical protein
MKTEQERAEIIKAINVLLNQAYDSDLDYILALLKRIEDAEDEHDSQAYYASKKDMELNGTVSWEEYMRESV